MSDRGADTADVKPGSRDRLLDAALAVFGERGMSGATTKEIARLAGVNEVTLFRYFDSKSGLFDAVLRERFPRAALLRELHFDRSRPIDEVLTTNSMRLLAILHANRDVAKMVILDLPRIPGRAQRDPFHEAFVGPLSGYLSVQLGPEEAGRVDTEVAASVLYGALRSHFIESYIGQGKELDVQADRRFVGSAVSIFLGGVRGKSAGQEEQRARKRVR